jgi:molybdopterin-guanine dinucleotide biosynthesis protein A
VLAGGASSRMGAPKELLDWHGTPLVAHVAGIVAAAVAPGPVVVVARRGQAVPPLPGGVEVVRDSVEGQGPLQALRDGLDAVAGRCDAAFVAATDLPLLRPELVRRVLDALEPDDDAAVPVALGRRHVLAAAYATGVVGAVDELLGEGERRVTVLLERCRVRLLDQGALLADRALARADPRLDSLANANTPAEWEDAVARGRGSAG